MSNDLFATQSIEGTVAVPTQCHPRLTAEIAAAIADTDGCRYLDQVMAMVGVDGLVEALRNSGLLAVIDQHAAAVRDSVEAADREVGPAALAGYARSVLAVQERHGLPVPDPDSIDWKKPSWTVLRLVAVCSLAEAADAF
jgi:hypothetical protein